MAPGPERPRTPSAIITDPHATPTASSQALTDLAQASYLVRAIGVAQAIREICIRNSEDALQAERTQLDLFPNFKADQIEPMGSLIFQINDNPYTEHRYNVALCTPIGTITCFRSKTKPSDSVLTEINQSFGLLKADPVLHPSKYLVSRDNAQMPFAQEWADTSPVKYRDTTECARLWAIAQELSKRS